jgi:hypothetical protein
MVHVEDLFLTCCKEGRIAELATGLGERYWEIKCVQGPVSNNLAMTEDEARITIKGFEDELLMWCEGSETAKSSAGEHKI